MEEDSNENELAVEILIMATDLKGQFRHRDSVFEESTPIGMVNRFGGGVLAQLSSKDLESLLD